MRGVGAAVDAVDIPLSFPGSSELVLDAEGDSGAYFDGLSSGLLSFLAAFQPRCWCSSRVDRDHLHSCGGNVLSLERSVQTAPRKTTRKMVANRPYGKNQRPRASTVPKVVESRQAARGTIVSGYQNVGGEGRG